MLRKIRLIRCELHGSCKLYKRYKGGVAPPHDASVIKPAGGDVHYTVKVCDIQMVRNMLGATRAGFPSTLPASGSPPGAFIYAVNQKVVK